MKRSRLPAILILASLALAGCSGGQLPFYRSDSSFTVESRGGDDAARLSTRFDRAVYRYDGKDTITIVLSAGPEENPTQAATVRVFWRPKAGRTPISSQATNATIQYVILPEGGDAGEVGVYSGAGFVFPKTKPGDTFFEAGVWDATLQLADRSDGFADKLGQSALRGQITARQDEAAVDAMLDRLSKRVTQRLGYPRFVSATP